MAGLTEEQKRVLKILEAKQPGMAALLKQQFESDNKATMMNGVAVDLPF